MRDYILSQIAQRQRTLSDLDKQIDRIDRQRIEIRAEMRAYEDMLGHLEPDVSIPAQMTGHVFSHMQAEAIHGNGVRRVRGSNWRGVYQYVAELWPNPVTIDAMTDYAASAGLTITRQAIRAQTSTYTQRGSLERVKVGMYRITAQGAAELGIDLHEKETAAPNPFEETAADSTQHDAESDRVVAG